jgi:hypothetical protein
MRGLRVEEIDGGEEFRRRPNPIYDQFIGQVVRIRQILIEL